MQVVGVGDPSGNSTMISFLPTYRHLFISSGEDDPEMFDDFSEANSRSRRKRSIYLQLKNTPISGTEKDIRQVPMDVLEDLLVFIGIPREVAKKVERWDRTWMLRKWASLFPGAKYVGDGSLYRLYSRDEAAEEVRDTRKERSKQLNRTDDKKARRELETTEAFCSFREMATRAYDNMEAYIAGTYAVKGTTTCNKKEMMEDEDELDAFVDCLLENILEENKEEEEEEKEEKVSKKKKKKKDELDEYVEQEERELKRLRTQVSTLEDRQAIQRAREQENEEIRQFLLECRNTLPRVKVMKRTIVEMVTDSHHRHSQRIRVEYVRDD
jgi:hypothetical protein